MTDVVLLIIAASAYYKLMPILSQFYLVEVEKVAELKRQNGDSEDEVGNYISRKLRSYDPRGGK